MVQLYPQPLPSARLAAALEDIQQRMVETEEALDGGGADVNFEPRLAPDGQGMIDQVCLGKEGGSEAGTV